jgi:glycosyltransferase involved in cell wall biosynthesis
MTLRVFVINLNNKGYTEKCINLLLNQNYNNFKITLFDQNSREEGTVDMLNYFATKNVDVIRNTDNDPLNSVWNLLYSMYREDILCFLNNDVLFYDNFISDVINVFEKEPNVGVAVHSTNHDDFIVKKDTTEYEIVERHKHMQGWDFSIRRDLYTIIPENLKTFCGDDFIFHHLYEKGFDMAYITSSPMVHFEGQSKPYLIHGRLESDIQTYIDMGYPHDLSVNTKFSKVKPTKIFIPNG